MSDQRGGGQNYLAAFIIVTTLFFAWGFVTSLIDPLVATVKGVFSLSYTEAMLTQFAWFIAYGVVSLPAAALLVRLGYSTAIIAALGAMLAGCLLVPLATHADFYPGVLFALFVIASGVTLLQVAANPLSAALGSEKGAHFRLTLSQAFNSLGTVIGPYLGASIMLSGGVFASGADAEHAATRAESLRAIDTSFLLVAAFFAVLTMFIWLVRKRIAAAAPAQTAAASVWSAFRSPWALFGGAAIFLYVGAEVAIASIMINFLVEIDFITHLRAIGFVDALAGLGLLDPSRPPEETAGRVLGLFYWGGAMIGRFVGSALLTRVHAGVLLSIAAAVAGALCLYVSFGDAPGIGVAALAVGFFNSIMFPTIFTLTLQRSSAPASATSGLLCMSIVGGAFLPLAAGELADRAGETAAFIVPLIGYLGILAFALAAARAKAINAESVAGAGH